MRMSSGPSRQEGEAALGARRAASRRRRRRGRRRRPARCRARAAMRVEIGKAALDERQPPAGLVDERRAAGDGRRVAIDGDDRGAPFEDGAAVAAGAESAVDKDATGGGRETGRMTSSSQHRELAGRSAERHIRCWCRDPRSLPRPRSAPAARWLAAELFPQVAEPVLCLLAVLRRSAPAPRSGTCSPARRR